MPRLSAQEAKYRKAARHAGLTYVTDGMLGIRRKRAGTGWAYYTPEGARIEDRATRARLNRLAIPPAWTNVWICPDADGHIQATGSDTRGRKQYRYHPDYREARDRSKFQRMLEFSEVLPRLREHLERDLRAPDLSRRQILATVVSLLDKTLIRVGNDEYMRANRSYGLTTLRRRHLEIDGKVLRFSFRGKSGVEHTIAVADPRLARIIQRCRELPGQELFQYRDGHGRRHLISSDDVNDYLRSIADRDISAKDFRTWGGTMLAARELRERGAPASKSEANRNVLAAIDAVAERLGNTRAVCRKYYIHPALIEAYFMGDTIPQHAPERHTRRSRHAALRRDEVLVLAFLQERL